MTDLHSDILFLEIALLISTVDLVAFFLFSFFPLLNVVRVILGFIMLTYVLGASIRMFLKNFVGFSNIPSTLSISGLSYDLLLSLVAYMAISIVLARTFLFYGIYFVTTTAAVIIALNSLSLLSLRRRQTLITVNETARVESKAGLVTSCVILLVASALFAAYFRSMTPYPMINGWDMNSALAYINWIIAHHGYSYILVPSFPSGGLPYPAFFFYMVSSYSLSLGVAPYVLFWLGICPLIFGYLLLIFLITFKLSSNMWLSITSSFIAFFASTACAEVVRNPLYLTLDMVSQLIFLTIIVFNIYDNSQGIQKRIFNLLLAFFLALFNYFTVIVVFPFLVWTIIGNNRIRFLGDGRKAFRIAALSMVLCAPILIALVSYTIPAVAALISSSFFTTSMKVEILQIIYPTYFWFLLGLSLFSIIINRKYFKGNDSPYLDLLLYIFCGFSLYFLPIWATYRIEFYVRVFLAISISSLGLLLDKGFFARILFSPSWKMQSKRIRLGGVVSFILLIITVSQMYPLFTQYTFYAYVSKDEYDASQWIKNNTPSTAYILTDPSSGYVIRGLSLRNASTYFVLPDGRIPADSSTLYPNLDVQLASFLSSPTGLDWGDVTDLLKLNPIYIVVTSRTVAWALSPSDVDITHPLDGVNYTLVTSKFAEPYFQEVYTSSTVKIYKPNPSLMVQQVNVWSDSNLTEGWSWYLDQSYGDNSYETNGTVLTLSTQQRESTSAFTGLTKEVNCSGANYLEIRSRIDTLPYLLEAVLTDAGGATVKTFYIDGERTQSTWIVDRFSLDSSEANRISKLSLIIWTKDTLEHTWEINYVTLGHRSFTIGSN